MGVSEYHERKLLGRQQDAIYFVENDTLTCGRSEALNCIFHAMGVISCTCIFHSEYSISHLRLTVKFDQIPALTTTRPCEIAKHAWFLNEGMMRYPLVHDQRELLRYSHAYTEPRSHTTSR